MMCFDYYEIIYFKSFQNELQKFFEVDLEKKTQAQFIDVHAFWAVKPSISTNDP